MSENQADLLKEAVLAHAPPGAVVIGLSVAPDGQRAAALTLLPTANYLMDDLFQYEGGLWQHSEGGSGGPGINWTGAEQGVLRFAGEAPDGAATAVIS